MSPRSLWVTVPFSTRDLILTSTRPKRSSKSRSANQQPTFGTATRAVAAARTGIRDLLQQHIHGADDEPLSLSRVLNARLLGKLDANKLRAIGLAAAAIAQLAHSECIFDRVDDPVM